VIPSVIASISAIIFPSMIPVVKKRGNGHATKAIKTFSLDKEVLAEVRRTKGARSESERVNNLLRFALELEKRASLYREAAGFFHRAPDDRRERRAYEAAAIRAWARD
jgi:hypothetical protein